MNRYGDTTKTRAAKGWTLDRLSPPSPLFGANGMRVGADGQLYVVQAFGSQVSALDPRDGSARTVSPVGGAIVAPDDVDFDSRGEMYVTEVMNARVCARSPSGEVRLIADNVPAANGITVERDRIFMDECRPGGRLFELYPDGREPRVIAENLPLPNALSMGPDGKLYFPLVMSGEIWRLDPDGGEPERFLDGLAVPTAVKFDTQGRLTTTQAASGEILQVDLPSRARHTVARVRPGIDNLAFADDGRLFVSHFIDGGVAEILADGRERVLAAPGLLGPFGVAVSEEGTVYAADGMSVVAVGPDGAVERPVHFTHPAFPGFVRGIAAAGSGAVFLSTSAGDVARLVFGAEEAEVWGRGLNEVYGMAATSEDEVVVAEGGEGRLLALRRDGELRVLARELGCPTGVAALPDGRIAVCETGRGRVSAVGDGVSTLLEGLASPQGIAVRGDRLLVLDAGRKELLAVSFDGSERQPLAVDLPVGPPPGVEPELLMGSPG